MANCLSNLLLDKEMDDAGNCQSEYFWNYNIAG